MGAIVGQAHASTAHVDSGVFAYSADPGEPNQVEFIQQDFTVTLSDAGAVIVAGDGCLQLTPHKVQCADIAGSVVLLGDLGDTASILQSDRVGWPEDRFEGEDGNDTITGCPGCYYILAIGGAGNDALTTNGRRLIGGPGNDTITGGVGQNHLFGGPGDDTLSGGEGSDRLRPGEGDDVVRGGPAADWIYFYTANSLTVDLERGQATGQGIDTILGVSNVAGGRGNDRLIGNGDRNLLRGGGGSDILEGRGGDDSLAASGILAGGADDDIVKGRGTLRGGAGDDGFRVRNRHRDVVRGGPGWDWARIDRDLDHVFGVQVFR